MNLIAKMYSSDCVSVDFLLAIPGEKPEEINKIKDFLEYYSPGHLSSYILTLEKGTLLDSQVNKFQSVVMPSESETVKSFKDFQKMMTSLDYSQYEISSYVNNKLGLKLFKLLLKL